MKGVVETKPSQSPEGDNLRVLTDKTKAQASNTKRCIGKNMQTNTQGSELETGTDFKGQCSEIEVHIFDLRPRSSDKFSNSMKEL